MILVIYHWKTFKCTHESSRLQNPERDCNVWQKQQEVERSRSASKCHMMDGYLLMDLKIIKLGSAGKYVPASL